MKKIIFILLLFPSLVFGQAAGKIIANKPTGGTIILDTINASSLLNLAQTTAGQTITIASLTSGGKIIYVRNVGSVSVTLSPGGSLPTGKTALMGWTGSTWSTTLIASSGGSFASLTGQPTDNANLATALNAKVNVSGDTMTGLLDLGSNDLRHVQNMRLLDGGQVRNTTGNASVELDASGEVVVTSAGNTSVGSGANIVLDADTTKVNGKLIVSGTIAGSNFSGTSSGTNTGDQTITLSSDVTGTGTGSIVSTISNDAVTYAKMQNIASGSLIGRSTAGSGDPESIAVGTGLLLSGGTLTAPANAAKQDTGTAVLRNGTRALTADWAVGSFNITGVKSLSISGTGGNGFINLITQSSTPATPANGINLYHKSTGFGYINSSGFTRDFTMPSSNAAYVFPSSDSLPGLARANQWTGINTFKDDLHFSSGKGLQDANGKGLIGFPSTVSSALNYFIVSNAASGSGPSLGIQPATGTNVTGVNNIIASQSGTGTGVESFVEFQTPNTTGSGTGSQSLAVRARIGNQIGNSTRSALFLHPTTPTGTNYTLVSLGSTGTTVLNGNPVIIANSSTTKYTFDVTMFTPVSTVGICFPPTSPAQITSNQNDYNPGTGVFFRLSSDASRNITGIATSGITGRVITIRNIGSQNIVFTHEDAGSASAARFTFSTGANITVLPNGSITLQYDGTSSRWFDLAVR